ncbi:MAG: hypothetical protein ACLP0L_09305, partial [Solirubrobacteraceae bacterium]
KLSDSYSTLSVVSLREEKFFAAYRQGVSDSVSEGATISVQLEPLDRLRRESFEGARKEG